LIAPFAIFIKHKYIGRCFVTIVQILS
jgi:hypothetical protein